MSLKNQTISGVFWNSSQRFSTLFIQFVVITIIARILTPSDFGLIGMLSIFSSLGLVILDSGFSQALIREQDVTQDDLSSIFYVQLIIGAGIYAILFYLSPAIANFFNAPKLVEIGRLVFLLFPLNSFGIIHMTLIRKKLKFKLGAIISIISVIISGLIGVIMAYSGFGVWALVFQMIFRAFIASILSWFVISWHPSFTFKYISLRKYIGFSSNLLITGVLQVLSRNIFTLIIGRFYPVAEVGFYNQAKRFEQIPSESLTAVIQSTSYPILSTIQNENTRLKRGYKKIITQTMLINSFMMFALIAVANNLFVVILTEKWNQSIPYFQILCLYGLLYPLHSINKNILKVKGKGKTIVLLEIIKNSLLFVSIAFTINKGVSILLVASVLTTFISVLISMYLSGKIINYGMKEQILDILPMISVFAIISLIVKFVDVIDFIPAIKLILQILLMLILSFLTCELLKIKAYALTKEMILEKYKILKNSREKK
jgi:O-antigen/teichoic acid export membrane protein